MTRLLQLYKEGSDCMPLKQSRHAFYISDQLFLFHVNVIRTM